MINLILQLPILAAILVSLLASFIIIFYLTQNKAIAHIFKKLNEYIFLFIASGVGIFPFSHLDLAGLGSHEKKLFSVVLLLVIYAVILILLRVRISQILTNIIILFQQKYLGIYLGLIVFSSFWSTTPLLTLRTAIALILISSFAVYFARAYNWQEIFKLLRWNQAIIIFFSAFISIFFPSLGQTTKGWGGGIGHPIDLGNMMALTTSLWLLNAIQNPKYRWRSLLFALLAVVIMQLANSAGAFIVFVSLFTVLLLFPLFQKLKPLQGIFLFISSLLFFLLSSFWLIFNLESILSLLNKDLNFTGRLPLWNSLIAISIKEKPWLGYGYSGFWQSWRDSDNPAAAIWNLPVNSWQPPHAHNGFLDIVLSIGIIGLIIFIFSFVTNIVRSIQLITKEREPISILPLIILTFVFVANFSQSAFITSNYTWFLYVVITVRLRIALKQKKYHAFNIKRVTMNTRKRQIG